MDSISSTLNESKPKNKKPMVLTIGIGGIMKTDVEYIAAKMLILEGWRRKNQHCYVKYDRILFTRNLESAVNYYYLKVDNETTGISYADALFRYSYSDNFLMFRNCPNSIKNRRYMKLKIEFTLKEYGYAKGALKAWEYKGIKTQYFPYDEVRFLARFLDESYLTYSSDMFIDVLQRYINRYWSDLTESKDYSKYFK